ncbi:hypothetical protein FBQ98_06585 [Gammaproteobacteria bacterium PRO6]|nr:hypothetical protein [Gammaproteobacteria bacterium PRO6]
MNEFVVLNLVLRKVVPVVATGLDRTFRLVGRVQRSSKPEKNDLTGAGGVPAMRTIAIPRAQARQASATQNAEPDDGLRADATSPRSAPSSSGVANETAAIVVAECYATPEHQGDDGDLRQEDDLDWAGSLAHAAAASLHIGNILAMVRAGWLIPDAEQLADITAALDAMEAFHTRTDSVIAPVLAAMDEDQQADFFGDFDADLPADLPELDGA